MTLRISRVILRGVFCQHARAKTHYVQTGCSPSRQLPGEVIIQYLAELVEQSLRMVEGGSREEEGSRAEGGSSEESKTS